MSDLAQIQTDVFTFTDLIARYTPATPEQIKGHITLENLTQLLGDDKLIYIYDDISIGDNPLSVNGEYVYTANTVAVILHDEQGEPSNLAFYPLDKTTNKGKPFLLHSDGRASSIIVGDGEIIACPTLDSLMDLYISINAREQTDTPAYTLIAPFEKWQFDSMVKAFAKQAQVTIFTGYAMREKQAKTFKRDNVRLVATVLPITELLLQIDGYGWRVG